MTESLKCMALFKDIDPAVEALDRLRSLGVAEGDMTVVSGVPFTEPMLGRPHQQTRIPLFAMAGFLVGFTISLALNWGTPFLYPVHVGGQPLYPIPTTLILTFEISMLGLMIFTFLGVIWESAFPAFGKKEYSPKISDGAIGVMFACSPQIEKQAHESLSALGAEWVDRTEAKVL